MGFRADLRRAASQPGELLRNQPAGTVTAHPDDKWGWAVGAGILLKMPWDAKDTFAVAGSYWEGATTYCVNTPGSFGARSSAASLFQDGGVAVGWWDDAYLRRHRHQSWSARTAEGLERQRRLPALLDQLAALLDLGLVHVIRSQQ